MQEAVEGVVGRLQVKEHLAHLGVIQLIGGRHAAQGLQPAGARRSGVCRGGPSRSLTGDRRVRAGTLTTG